MDQHNELIRLLSSLCDEQFGDMEAQRLEELLHDEGNRRVYIQYMDMQARLVKLGDEEPEIRRDVAL